MVASDPLLRAPRASDADRERVIETLRAASDEGRLSLETCLRRMDAALRARRQNELAGLVADLQPAARPRWDEPLLRAVREFSALTQRIRAAWHSARLPRIVLPRDGRTVLTIGRSGECDLALADPTVSSRHAELRLTEDGWVLADLGSTNGTRVNGWRVAGGALVHDGDVVALGAARFRLRELRG